MTTEPISYSQDLPFRLITMSATVITPQLMTILQDIIDAASWDSDLHRCASQTLQHCQDCSRHYLSNASRQLGINTETLLLAQNLYGILESSILAASIEDKISLYQTVYLTALKQTENDLPYNISLQACSFYQPSITAICNRQNLAETINEYSEEIETWLDIQFADEYDDFTSQPDFDPITELMVALEMLTALLSGGRENSL